MTHHIHCNENNNLANLVYISWQTSTLKETQWEEERNQQTATLKKGHAHKWQEKLL